MCWPVLALDYIPEDERTSALHRHFGHTSPGYANGLRQHLDALRFGTFPHGPSMARNIADRLKSMMRIFSFSDSSCAIVEKTLLSLRRSQPTPTHSRSNRRGPKSRSRVW